MEIEFSPLVCQVCKAEHQVELVSVHYESETIRIVSKISYTRKQIKMFDSLEREITSVRYNRWYESYKYALSQGATKNLAKMFASYREYRSEFSGGRIPVAQMWDASKKCGFRFASGRNVKRYTRFADRMLKIGK